MSSVSRPLEQGFLFFHTYTPESSVEVQFLEWTDQGQARHLSYKGTSAPQ